MGTSPPLEIPEIVSNVLQFCDYPTLFRAAQVNSVWAEHATNWLWRGEYRGPHDSHSRALQTLLDACPDRKRRNWYTKKIRYLDIEQCDQRDDDVDQIAYSLKEKQFTFPHVKSVIIDLGSENMDEKVMAQFLSHGLITLELYGGHYTRWFLSQIQVHAPSLRYFLVDNALVEDDGPSDKLNSSHFRRFLEEMPSITHLELHRGWVPLMDDDVWRSIMLRPNLEFFYPSSAKYLEWDSFSRLVTDSLPGEIFPSLRCLEVAADTKTFQFLLPRLSALQEFVMGTYIDFSQSASLGPIMQSLTSCSLLETGIFVGSGPVTSADLLNLASCCPLLSRLDVNLQSRQLEDALDDEQFNTFVSRLKHLTVLQLRLPVNLSFQSLASVAIHCPQMRSMQVRARIDVAKLANAPYSIRFPSMESLVVSDVFMDGEWCSSSTSGHNWSKGSNPAL